eukprot:361565-Chlamydomonas_euryale.AAC.4
MRAARPAAARTALAAGADAPLPPQLPACARTSSASSRSTAAAAATPAAPQLCPNSVSYSISRAVSTSASNEQRGLLAPLSASGDDAPLSPLPLPPAQLGGSMAAAAGACAVRVASCVTPAASGAPQVDHAMLAGPGPMPASDPACTLWLAWEWAWPPRSPRAAASPRISSMMRDSSRSARPVNCCAVAAATVDAVGGTALAGRLHGCFRRCDCAGVAATASGTASRGKAGRGLRERSGRRGADARGDACRLRRVSKPSTATASASVRSVTRPEHGASDATRGSRAAGDAPAAASCRDEPGEGAAACVASIAADLAISMYTLDRKCWVWGSCCEDASRVGARLKGIPLWWMCWTAFMRLMSASVDVWDDLAYFGRKKHLKSHAVAVPPAVQQLTCSYCCKYRCASSSDNHPPSIACAKERSCARPARRASSPAALNGAAAASAPPPLPLPSSSSVILVSPRLAAAAAAAAATARRRCARTAPERGGAPPVPACAAEAAAVAAASLGLTRITEEEDG